MSRSLRVFALVLALALAAPATVVPVAHASTEPAQTDLGIPRLLLDWLKRNGPTLYIIFDEIMDDLFGCDCPPPPGEEPPPPPPTQP